MTQAVQKFPVTKEAAVLTAQKYKLTDLRTQKEVNDVVINALETQTLESLNDVRVGDSGVIGAAEGHTLTYVDGKWLGVKLEIPDVDFSEIEKEFGEINKTLDTQSKSIEDLEYRVTPLEQGAIKHLCVIDGVLWTDLPFVSEQSVSAKGLGTGGGGSSTGVDILNNWDNYNEVTKKFALSSELGWGLKQDISANTRAIDKANEDVSKLTVNYETLFANDTLLQEKIDNLSNVSQLLEWFKKDDDGNIYTTFNFYSTKAISTKGVGSGSNEGDGGASMLYQLYDVQANAEGNQVAGAVKGNVLTFNGTHWEGTTIEIPDVDFSEITKQIDALDAEVSKKQDRGELDETLINYNTQINENKKRSEDNADKVSKILKWFTLDEENDLLLTTYNLASEKSIAAKGASTADGGDGGNIDILDNWDNYGEDTKKYALSAELGAGLRSNVLTNAALISTLADNVTTLNYQVDGLLADYTGINKKVDNLEDGYLDVKGKVDNLTDWFRIDDDGNVYTPFNFYSTKSLSAKGMGSDSSGADGVIALYKLYDVQANSANNNVEGAEEGNVLTYHNGLWKGSKFEIPQVDLTDVNKNIAALEKADEYLFAETSKIAGILTNIATLFEDVSANSYRIGINELDIQKLLPILNWFTLKDGTLTTEHNLVSNKSVSAKGTGTDGEVVGANALHQLNDVKADGNKVQGATKGSVLTYDGTHWVGTTITTPEVDFTEVEEKIGALLNTVNSNTKTISDLSTDFYTFLTGADTDETINKWKELEEFLQGFDSTNDLANLLLVKVDKEEYDKAVADINKELEHHEEEIQKNTIAISEVKDWFTLDKDSETLTTKYNLVSSKAVSAKGVGTSGGGSSEGGANTLYQLWDVLKDSSADKVAGAEDGNVLVYKNGKWQGSQLDIPEVNFEEIENALDGLDATVNAHTTQINGLQNTVTEQGREIAKRYLKPSTGIPLSDLASGIQTSLGLANTAFQAAAFTEANIKTTLGISDWALNTVKPSYKTSEITEENNLYFTNERAVTALKPTTDALSGRITLIEDWFTLKDGTLVTKYNLVSEKAVSAKGVGSEGEDNGVSYDRLDTWDSYTSDKAGYVLSAALGWDLKTMIENLDLGDFDLSEYYKAAEVDRLLDGKQNAIADLAQIRSNAATAFGWGDHSTKGYLVQSSLNGYVNEIATTGDGNAITAVTKDGKKITFNKGVTFLTDHQNIFGLTIKGSDGTTILSYTPNLGAKELTLSKSHVGLNNVENTKLSTWAGTNKITTLGTITTGTWKGSKIANDYLVNPFVTIAGTKVALGDSISVEDLQQSLDIVTTKGDQDITGIKTFKNGIKIGNAVLWVNEDGVLMTDVPFASLASVSAKGIGTNGGTGGGGGGSTIDLTNVVSNILPSTSAYTIGSLAKPWGGVYANSIYMNGNLVATDADLNTLEDALLVLQGTLNTANGNIQALQNSLKDYQPLATAINTGNIASQSVNYATNAGNANTLGNLSYTGYMRSARNADLQNTAGNLIIPVLGSPTWNDDVYKYGVVLQWCSNYTSAPDTENKGLYYAQLYSIAKDDGLYYRRKYSNSDWRAFKQIAFTDSDITGNAATATKLKDSVTLWGQSFDGSQGVSGNLVLGYNSIYGAAGENALAVEQNRLSVGYGFRDSKLVLYGNLIQLYRGEVESLRINSLGNVTIGPGDSAGSTAKLYVDGHTVLGNGAHVRMTDTNNAPVNILELSANNVLHFGYGSAAKSYKTHINGYDIIFSTNSSHAESMLITRDGKVLIGTTGTDSYNMLRVAGGIGNYYGTNGYTLTDYGSIKYIMTSDFTTGWSRGYFAEIDGSTVGGIGLYGGSGQFRFAFINAGDYNTSNGLRVYKSGQVAIGGTENGSYKLYVNGDSRVNGTLSVGNTDAATIVLNRANHNYIWASAAGGTLVFGVKDVGGTGQQHASLSIGATSLTSGTRNNAVSLGTSSYRWSNVYSVNGDYSGNLTVTGSTTTGDLYINGVRLWVEDGVLYTDASFASKKAVSAKGLGTSSEGAGVDYDRLDSWDNYDSTKAGYVLSAKLGYELKDAIDNIDIPSLSGVATETWVEGKLDGLAKVAKTGLYSDLSGVPTKVSQFTNDKSYQTLTEVNALISTFKTNIADKTYYLASNFTKDKIKSTLGISDWALAETVPTTDAVAEGKANLYFTTTRVKDYLTGAISTVLTAALTANRVVVSNTNGKITASGITTTKLGYLTDVTSNIQAQFTNTNTAITGVSNRLTKVEGWFNDDVEGELSTTRNIKTTGSIAIGDATLSWDGTTLIVDKPFASTQSVSAKGIGTNGGGSGSAVDLTNVVSDIIPASSTYKIGSSAKPFGSVYANSIYMNGNLVVTQGDLTTYDNALLDLQNNLDNLQTSIPSTYATIKSLEGYLPLSGGTMTGQLGFSGSTYPNIYGNGTYLMLAATNDKSIAVIAEKFGFRPYANNTMSLGISGNRWSNVYSVSGNFSGKITSSVADGTAPFVVASKTLVSNLNADMLDGKHLSDILASDITGNAATATYATSAGSAKSLSYTRIHPFDRSTFGYKKFASVNLTSRYSSKVATLLLQTISATQKDFGSFCHVYLHAYQQDSLGNPPAYSITTDCDDQDFSIYGVLNYSSTESIIELYAYGKNKSYFSISVSTVSGNDIVSIGEESLSALPSGTAITPTKTGTVFSATKLATAITLWGKSFDGSGNVSGNMTSVANITSVSREGETNPAYKLVYDADAFYLQSGNGVMHLSGYNVNNLSSLTVHASNSVFTGNITSQGVGTFVNGLAVGSDSIKGRLAFEKSTLLEAGNGALIIKNNSISDYTTSTKGTTLQVMSQGAVGIDWSTALISCGGDSSNVVGSGVGIVMGGYPIGNTDFQIGRGAGIAAVAEYSWYNATGLAFYVNHGNSSGTTDQFTEKMRLTYDGNLVPMYSTAQTLGASDKPWGSVFANTVNAKDVKSPSELQLISTDGSIKLLYNNDTAKSVVLNGSAFKPYDGANEQLTLGTTTARWKNVYSVAIGASGTITAGSNVMSGTGSEYGVYMTGGDTRGTIATHQKGSWVATNMYLYPDGGIKANYGLTVGGTTQLNSSLSVTGTTTLNDKLTINKNGMSVTGAAYFGGGTTYYFGSTGNVSANTLNAAGAATLKSTLAVTGATTLTGLLTANGGVTVPSTKTIKIGDGTISWDSTNNAFKFSHSVYSLGAMSAKGIGTSGGTGGGGVDVDWLNFPSSIIPSNNTYDLGSNAKPWDRLFATYVGGASNYLYFDGSGIRVQGILSFASGMDYIDTDGTGYFYNLYVDGNEVATKDWVESNYVLNSALDDYVTKSGIVETVISGTDKAYYYRISLYNSVANAYTYADIPSYALKGFESIESVGGVFLADDAMVYDILDYVDAKVHSYVAQEINTFNENLATVATSGKYSDLTGKPTTLSGYGITDAFARVGRNNSETKFDFNTYTDFACKEIRAKEVAYTNSPQNYTTEFGLLVNLRDYNNFAKIQLYGGNNADLKFRVSQSSASTISTAWRRILDSSNFSNYALPLTGGEIKGSLGVTVNITAQGGTFVNGLKVGGNDVIHSGNIETTVTGGGVGLVTGGAVYSFVEGSLSGYAKKATTLSGYGITDALPKSNPSVTGTLTVAGNVLPSANDTHALGSTNYRWSKLYTNGVDCTGTISSTTNISAQGNVTAINGGLSGKTLSVSGAASVGSLTVNGVAITGNGGGSFNGGTVSGETIFGSVGSNYMDTYQVYIGGVYGGGLGVEGIIDAWGGVAGNGWEIMDTGDAYFQSCDTASDYNLKTIIKDVRLSLGTMANAPLVQFDWKNKPNNKHHIGTIAQYWDSCLPEVVSRTKNDTLALSYGELGVAMGISLAKEMIEMLTRVDNTESEIDKLKKRISELEKEIENLKA